MMPLRKGWRRVVSQVWAGPLGTALVALVAVVLIVTSLVALEQARSGLEMTEIRIGTTPATLTRKPDHFGPVVVVAHGFAGSRPMMEAFSLNLARAGYTVLAFDFEGHGRNPVPMSGDVRAIDGTTALLVAETRRVIAAGRALRDPPQPIALLGHSMATDILIRAAQAEDRDGQPIEAVIAISMFSQAVTSTFPPRLLVITGQGEPRLRKAALDALHLVQPGLGEGETASAGQLIRRAVVAPGVEHVGVLFSLTAIREAVRWLDTTFGQTSTEVVAPTGLWIILLLGGIVMLLRPLASRLPPVAVAPDPLPAKRFWLALLVPAALVPLVGTMLYRPFMPVLVADYLVAHLAAYALLQGLILGKAALPRTWSWPAFTLLVVWGIGVFGLAMDRYAASFVPNTERLVIILILCFGTIPFMVADSVLTGAGRGSFRRRVAARIVLLASLAGAAMLDPPRLMFLFIILPVMVLFFLVHGLMGRWIGQRSGAITAGLGLGLCLAWALGVSFPLFRAT
jgi:pimeloyl-ACP methyl ester carboxylesterase